MLGSNSFIHPITLPIPASLNVVVENDDKGNKTLVVSRDVSDETAEKTQEAFRQIEKLYGVEIAMHLQERADRMDLAFKLVGITPTLGV